MDTLNFEFDNKQWLAERRDALLSMDKRKILEYSRKYYCDDGFDEIDEFTFWVGVHKARSCATNLPEFERRLSMSWLTERGFTHFASDLVEQDAATQCNQLLILS